MQHRILFLLMLMGGWGLAQPTNTSLKKLGNAGGNTYAVIIGISDYQDPAIPDLRFADRDAEAFAQWLRSPAGGSLPPGNIHVLTNKDATTGKIIAALDGLIENCKPGDEAIIYFSGHGDVERVTKFQRGFLLTYDSPPVVYAAGAFSLQYLQDIITTLSESGVQTMVIADACRAGKLSGSEFGGTRATSAALAQQFANEIKILSCQPEEFSLEGEQWGGGRGCFSYHLVDALYGMADANEDGIVSLLELGRYLEDKVTNEAAPHSQIPFTVGSKSAHISSVNDEVLAKWRNHKGEEWAFQKIDTRGLEDLTLGKADTGILKMYHAFNAAMEDGNLMATDSTQGQSADDYFKVLIQEPTIAGLHGLMTRNFAAALMDEGQQVINRFLKTDPETVNNVWANPIKYDHIPAQMNRAAALLGEKHYVYKTLKAKEYFFKAKKIRKDNYPDWSLDSIYSIKKNLLETGLSYDSTAAYLFESFYEFFLVDSNSVHYLEKAVEYAPKWALAHFELAKSYGSNRRQLSLEHLIESIKIDSNFLSSYRQIAWTYESLVRADEARLSRETYLRKAQERFQLDSTSMTAYELNSMGNVLWRLKRYKEAEEALKKALNISTFQYNAPFSNLLCVLLDQGKFEDFIETFEKHCTETHVGWYGLVGNIYLYYLNNLEQAELCYQKLCTNDNDLESVIGSSCFELAHFHRVSGNLNNALTILQASEFNYPWYNLEMADLLLQMGNATEARPFYDRILLSINPTYIKDDIGDITSFGGPHYLYQIIALQRLGKTEEMEAAIKTALTAPHCDGWRHFWMACTFAQIGNLDEAMKHLDLSEKADWEPNPVNWIYGTTKDIYLDPLRDLPAFQAWEQRWLPPYKDYSKD